MEIRALAGYRGDDWKALAWHFTRGRPCVGARSLPAVHRSGTRPGQEYRPVRPRHLDIAERAAQRGGVPDPANSRWVPMAQNIGRPGPFRRSPFCDHFPAGWRQDRRREGQSHRAGSRRRSAGPHPLENADLPKWDFSGLPSARHLGGRGYSGAVRVQRARGFRRRRRLHLPDRGPRPEMLRRGTGWISSFMENADGSVWVGGRNLTTWQRGRVGNLSPDLEGSGVQALLSDAGDRVFVGASNGIYEMDRSRLAPRRVTGDYRLAVIAIVKDREGSLWMATD